MKTRHLPGLALCAAWIALGPAVAEPETPPALDPTVPADAMAERLKGFVADAQKLRALVVGAADDGVALVGEKTVRRGGVLAETVDGVKVELAVTQVTSGGVALAGGVTLSGSFSPLPPPAEAPAEFLRYIESAAVPLETLMRLVSDQAGVNIAVSDAAAKRNVSIFLRNVTAESAVEEICRATDLLYRRGHKGEGIIRIMTKAEYNDNLNSFREEVTEMFTLLYPNVVEVASVIYGIYPDRTFLSLGEEEFEEDEEYDLGRRFRRFRVLEDNGGSQFMAMESPQTGSTSVRSGGGDFSFSRGGAISRLSQWDEVRRRARTRGLPGRNGADTGFSMDEAMLLSEAAQAGDTNFLDRVRAHVTASAANIFVSMSRKNNMLIVRTSDTRAMDEIRGIVKRLDVPTPMVLMEVKVLEVSLDDNYEASFTYSFNRDTHTVGNSGRVALEALDGGMNAFTPSFAFTVVNKAIEAKVKLLQQDGKIKTLATPTLLVANNEVARIFAGKEYPLVSGWRPAETVVSESGIVQGAMTVEITKEDVGTMLLITPNINADKTVTLRLLQENSAVSPEKVDIPVDGGNGETRQIEYVESRSLAGTFVAKDGMTLLAGGLVKETEGQTYWRTPVLGSIPLVGWLFRGTEKVRERTELIVLIRPHVISTPVEGGKISRELLKALSAHPAADGRASMGVLKRDVEHDVGDDVKNMAGQGR